MYTKDDILRAATQLDLELNKTHWYGDGRFPINQTVTGLLSVLESLSLGNVQEIILVSESGQERKMVNVGKGLYPYDCPDKRKYPNSYIFKDGSGAWVASHYLRHIDGIRYGVK